MKTLFLIINITLVNLIYAQEKIIFFDTLSNAPIKNVHVYSSNELLTLSNENGEIELANSSYPIKTKSWAHHDLTVESQQDTIFLAPKFQQMEEVTIKPIDYNQFYKELVKSSQQKVLSDTSTLITGDFFHSLMFIDLKSHDSIYILKKCDLTLKQKRTSKKIDYEFYPSNGEKFIRFEGSKKSKDTSKISSMNAFIPKFTKMLQYDLSKTKKYKVEFENKQAHRELGESNSLFVEKNSDKYKTEIQVDYINDCINQFQKEINGDCSKPTKFLNISMCIKNQSQTIEFEEDNNHQLKSIVFHITIDYTIDDDPYTIKVAQGFIQSNYIEHTISNSFNDMDTYFKSIDFSEDSTGLNFYQF
tara:strand:+ start:1199 stop:2278 length:1080 start_codon:yes stop_codon:yes gene_type:complete